MQQETVTTSAPETSPVPVTTAATETTPCASETSLVTVTTAAPVTTSCASILDIRNLFEHQMNVFW